MVLAHVRAGGEDAEEAGKTGDGLPGGDGRGGRRVVVRVRGLWQGRGGLFLGVGVGGEADVEALDGVGLGFAVGAVAFGGGAVGFDYVFFFEV